MRVIQYYTVVSNNATDLDEQVNGLLKEDWQPKGVAHQGPNGAWYQTMVKKSDGNG